MCVERDDWQECQFCRLVRAGRSLYFEKIMGSREEVIFRDEHFILIPDVAPCRPGHVLAVATQHVTSMAALWASGEVERLIEKVSSALMGYAPAIAAFEHGVEDQGKAASCVEHAHLHLIPSSERFGESLGREIPELQEVEAPSIPQSNEYAVLRDTDGRWFQAIGASIPGQSIRRAAIPASHGPYWNWLDFVQFPEPLHTKERISEGAAYYRAIADALRAA